MKKSLLTVLILLLCVCGTQTSGAASLLRPDNPKGNKVGTTLQQPSGDMIVKTALQYLGTRYRAGQSSPKGFDCSGFTSFVYKRADISLTRSSRTQYQEGTAIKKISELRKGDLVFFGGSRGTHTVGHVGIVTDVAANGKSFNFIHAARTGVQIDNSSQAYYSKRYIGARRILSE